MIDPWQREECQLEAPKPALHERGPEAARRWIDEGRARANRIITHVARYPSKRETWMEILAGINWACANAWTYAWGDTEAAREVREQLRQRAAILWGVLWLTPALRQGRPRSTRYPGSELVERHIGPTLDRMYAAPSEAARIAMLPDLRRVAEVPMGESVAAVLDPFLPGAR